MLKPRTATERSDQTVTCARTAWGDELLTDNRVVWPLKLLRSTSKNGSSSVAAGSGAVLRVVAAPAPEETASPSRQAIRPRMTRGFAALNILTAPFRFDRPCRS